MKVSHWLLAAGGLLAVVGAVLVFALDDNHAAVIGVELQPLGGVVLVGGLLLILAVAIASIDGGSGGRSSGASNVKNVKALAGLIAVAIGVVVVGGLAAFTMTRLKDTETESAVAIATAAFGVISALISAYLGIKVSSEHSTDAKDAATAQQEADQAKQEAELAQAKLTGVTSEVQQELPPEQANSILAAGFKAGEEKLEVAEDPA